MTGYNFIYSKTFWTTVVLVAYNVLTTLIPVFPNHPAISTVVDILGIVLVTVFHVSGVSKAAVASAALGSPVSGQ